jgi:DNA-binding MurR/RpiR family transcriptional regulator
MKEMTVTTTETYPDSGAETLLVRLRGLMPTLAESERAVGRLVLDQPAETARIGISELARRAGTSATTVTRFCRSIGLSGYQELRLLLAVVGYKQEAAGRQLPIGDAAEIAADDPLPAITRKVAIASQQAIQDTLETFDLSALASAVEVLSGARKVDIYGVGSSDVVVADLHHKLSHLGLIAVAYSDVHRSIASAAHLGKGDVAIGVSHSGRTAEVLDPMRVARERGAVTIAVTNYPHSPLAGQVDIVLASAGQEDVLFRTGATVSRIAQLYVTDCLFVALAQHRGEQTWQAFEQVHQAVSSRTGERARSRRTN